MNLIPRFWYREPGSRRPVAIQEIQKYLAWHDMSKCMTRHVLATPGMAWEFMAWHNVRICAFLVAVRRCLKMILRHVAVRRCLKMISKDMDYVFRGMFSFMKSRELNWYCHMPAGCELIWSQVRAVWFSIISRPLWTQEGPYILCKVTTSNMQIVYESMSPCLTI